LEITLELIWTKFTAFQIVNKMRRQYAFKQRITTLILFVRLEPHEQLFSYLAAVAITGDRATN
jgi:hypothetical protein